MGYNISWIGEIEITTKTPNEWESFKCSEELVLRINETKENSYIIELSEPEGRFYVNDVIEELTNSLKDNYENILSIDGGLEYQSKYHDETGSISVYQKDGNIFVNQEEDDKFNKPTYIIKSSDEMEKIVPKKEDYIHKKALTKIIPILDNDTCGKILKFLNESE